MGHKTLLNLSPGDDALNSHLGWREEVRVLPGDEQGSPSVLQARFGQRHRWHEVPGHCHAVCGRRMGDNSQAVTRTALLGAHQECQRIPALLIWLATFLPPAPADLSPPFTRLQSLPRGTSFVQGNPPTPPSESAVGTAALVRAPQGDRQWDVCTEKALLQRLVHMTIREADKTQDLRVCWTHKG